MQASVINVPFKMFAQNVSNTMFHAESFSDNKENCVKIRQKQISNTWTDSSVTHNNIFFLSRQTVTTYYRDISIKKIT